MMREATARLWCAIRRSRKVVVLFGVVLAVLLLRVLPKQALQDVSPSSRSVISAKGELLRLTLAADEQYRLWTPLDEIAPSLQRAVVMYEDDWFYVHPGVNPWSLLRAATTTATGTRRIGGSTLTMQLARRIYDIDSRSVQGKLAQVFAALWLELRYSKHDILEAYLNYAPFGGNIEGVGAASLIYLHKSARALNVPESLNLAVIPQNPRKRLAHLEADSKQLQSARERLAARWARTFPDQARFALPAALQMSFSSRAQLPFRAPHLVDYLLRQNADRVMTATLDLPTQAVLERVLSEYVKARADAGISNASALLVDASTMQVKALVGSADYQNSAIAGQVNGVLGKRSPGSTLKPYIYGLALDQGLIHSASILKDAPASFGAYSPENFDGRFTGPVSAQDALIRSRNVPAVALAARLSRPSLYEFLKLAGVQKMQAESHYGLSLVLGGGEVTMEELAQLYAMLANRGEWRALRYLEEGARAANNAAQADSRDKPLTLLSPAAAFVTQDMLRQTPRPDTYAPARPAVAWKTGTSWGFRDAWTAGVFGRYVLVVWVGNFDGSSNPAFIGVEAAAPLFFRIIDALRAERLDPGEMAHPVPADLQRVEVCTASGDLPNDACPVRTQAWFIPGKSPIRTSTLHRKLLIDTRTGRVVCAPNAYTREESFEYWPSDLAAVFARAGMPLRQPPSSPCGEEVQQDGSAPSIASPLRGVTHIQRLGKREPVYLRAEAGTDSGALHWFVDDALIGSSTPGQTISWNPVQAGRYVLRVVDSMGRSDAREIVFELGE